MDKQREIKFRAWRKEEKKMLKWEHIAVAWTAGALKDDQFTVVMQYTGLKDKNGKEIYEGDIIKGMFSLSGKMGVVKYFEKYAGFGFTTEYWGKMDFNFKNNDLSRYKVVGNVFENPELLSNK